MIENADLSPLYKLVVIAADEDPLSRALELATSGADPATVICADRADLLECAIILHPDMPTTEARLVIYAAMLGLGDALGSVVPAGIDVTFRWPNLIEANIGRVAHITLSLPPSTSENEVPAWMILRITVAIDSSPNALEGERSKGLGFETSLAGEGAVEVTAVALLESFSRHFLTWISRWQDDGFNPLRTMWLHRTIDLQKPIDLEIDGIKNSGTFAGIAEDGDLILQTPETTRQISLGDVLNI
jgi:biotin-(acetyl-CoA carboxylase) ligase